MNIECPTLLPETRDENIILCPHCGDQTPIIYQVEDIFLARLPYVGLPHVKGKAAGHVIVTASSRSILKFANGCEALKRRTRVGDSPSRWFYCGTHVVSTPANDHLGVEWNSQGVFYSVSAHSIHGDTATNRRLLTAVSRALAP